MPETIGPGDLASWVIPVTGIDESLVRAQDVHGWVAREWLDHDSVAWTAALVVVEDGTVLVRITTLDESSRVRLLGSVKARGPIQLGRQRGTVSSEPQLVEAANWPDLLTVSGQLAWTIRFATPTAFVRGRNAPGPWPDPFTIVGSLEKRWNALAPSSMVRTAPDPKLLNSLNVAEYELSNVRFSLRKSVGKEQIPISASVGHIFMTTASREAAVLVEPLLRLAEFSGLGAYAKWGLGVVSVEYLTSHVKRKAM